MLDHHDPNLPEDQLRDRAETAFPAAVAALVGVYGPRGAAHRLEDAARLLRASAGQQPVRETKPMQAAEAKGGLYAGLRRAG